MDAKLQQLLARELHGGVLFVEPASGPPLAQVDLDGRTDTVITDVLRTGKAQKVSIQNAMGESLGAVAAAEVCDRTLLEQGGKVTVSIRLG